MKVAAATMSARCQHVQNDGSKTYQELVIWLVDEKSDKITRKVVLRAPMVCYDEDTPALLNFIARAINTSKEEL